MAKSENHDDNSEGGIWWPLLIAGALLIGAKTTESSSENEVRRNVKPEDDSTPRPLRSANTAYETLGEPISPIEMGVLMARVRENPVRHTIAQGSVTDMRDGKTYRVSGFESCYGVEEQLGIFVERDIVSIRYVEFGETYISSGDYVTRRRTTVKSARIPLEHARIETD
jgi:hypothetical protein